MRIKIISISILSLLTHYANAGTVFTVGTEASCDFNNIQLAIENNTASEIRLSNQSTFHENLVLDDFTDMSIIGGYNSCEDAANNILSETYSTISGDINNDDIGDDTVMIITNSGTLTLEGLKIQNGQTFQLASPAGGITLLDFDGTLNLSKLYITSNIGNGGGGIAIVGNTAELVIGSDVLVFGNSAVNGGGIYCTGGSTIIMGEDALNSGIIGNKASLNGGGVYLTNACEMELNTGEYGQFESSFVGIRQNKAANHGGGIFLKSASNIALIGKNNKVVNVSANIADSDQDNFGNGGGIYATGVGTTISASNISIDNNTAMFGGGIHLEDQANLSIKRDSKSCWNKNHCNFFEFNQASNSGGAINTRNATISIAQAVFEENRADFGTVINLDNSTAKISSSIFSHNGNDGEGALLDESVIFISDSNLGFDFNTVADNNAKNSVFHVLSNLSPSIINVFGSIFDDVNTGSVLIKTGGILPVENFDCIAAHEDQSFTASTVTTANPEFVNKANRDYHLNAALTPLIDKCKYDEPFFDIDMEVRGWDDPTAVGTGEFVYDIGADETYDNDIIFKDDFEQEE